jgi:hypothetical protein
MAIIESLLKPIGFGVHCELGGFESMIKYETGHAKF